MGTVLTRKARRFVLVLAVVAATTACDQAAKRWAAHALQGVPVRSYLSDTVRLQYVENDGAFLGWGHGWSPWARFWILTVASAAALAVMLGTLVRSGQTGRLSFVALSLLAAGGAANVLDRMTRSGRVVDFLNLGVGPLRTGIFNVADVAITCGVVCLTVAVLRRTTEVPRDRTFS